MTKRIAVWLGASVLGVSPLAWAFIPQVEPPLGMIGVTQGQTAEVFVVMGVWGQVTPNDVCPLGLSWVDAKGQVLVDRTGNQVMKTVVLQPGVADSLQVAADDILGGALRASIRAVVVEQPPNPAQPSNCTGFVVTLEIVNASGETQVFYSPIPDAGKK